MVVKKEDKFRKGMRGCCEKFVIYFVEWKKKNIYEDRDWFEGIISYGVMCCVGIILLMLLKIDLEYKKIYE